MVSHWVLRASVLSLMAFPIACSGAGAGQGAPSPAGAAASASPAGTDPAASAEEIGNPRDWAHVVSLSAPSEAYCAVYQEGAKGNASTTMNAYSGKAGLLRFFPPPASWGTRLAVECQSTAGAPMPMMAVDLRDRKTYAEEDLSGPPPVIGVRPPLHGDPMSLTQEQLIAGHYGHRPDPVTEAASYARWLERASRTLDIVDAKGVANPSRKVLHTFLDYEGTPNWGGPALVNGPYVEVQGDIRVPSFPAQGSLHSSAAADWVGLGGLSSIPGVFDGVGDSLVQAGLDYNPDGTVKFWYEYVVGSEPPVTTNFVVHQQDDVYISAYVHDAGGNYNVNGGYAGFDIIDDTSNTMSFFTYIHAPPNVNFSGKTAEWIIETPCAPAKDCPANTTCPACPFGSGVMLPLTNFGVTWTTQTYAYIPQANGTGYGGTKGLGTDDFVMFQLLNQSSQQLENSYFPQGQANIDAAQVLNQWLQAR